MARRLGPAHPLGTTWNGAGACVIFSQSRQVNLGPLCGPSPYRLDHLPPARLRLQRLRHVLAELAQAVSTTAVARCRWINHHALARKMLGERIALGTFACE